MTILAFFLAAILSWHLPVNKIRQMHQCECIRRCWVLGLLKFNSLQGAHHLSSYFLSTLFILRWLPSPTNIITSQ
ncbi:Hypothetical protein PP7435_CHR1-3369 [Komagataella phaffii CBS 7435]|nr:Hypothetical protein BQ9382_C1-8091 [Komagataella phaffii CBS 7435]SCV11952.1 Hypothetical protein PP7435_CHR1-3369 [Komagataella phaffii CBS 7435]